MVGDGTGVCVAVGSGVGVCLGTECGAAVAGAAQETNKRKTSRISFGYFIALYSPFIIQLWIEITDPTMNVISGLWLPRILGPWNLLQSPFLNQEQIGKAILHDFLQQSGRDHSSALQFCLQICFFIFPHYSEWSSFEKASW
jgi:hypothetical protein